VINLEHYGFTHFYKNQIDSSTESDVIAARITAVHKNIYKIISENGESSAKLAGTAFYKIKETENFPAVGDFVLIRYNTQGNSVITKILERKSKFSRPNHSGHAIGYVKTVVEQVLAANFDYVFVLSSLNHDFNINRIQRYLAVAWQSNAIPVIILTKADLIDNADEKLKEVQQIAKNVDIIVISALTKYGFEYLSEYLKPAKTVVFLGSSGVGKSSLVNALAEKELMNVSAIRENDSKGHHTTTHRELIMMPNGSMIIDTPGIRELGMIDINDGFSKVFGDIEDYIGLCKFSDCKHNNEPGCAIKTAISEGKFTSEHWQNYQSLKKEAKFSEDKAAALREKNEWHKSISKFTKNNQKPKL